MNRKTLWQITAIASAAALVGIAQAQSDTSTSAAPMTTEERVTAEAAEMAAQPVTTDQATDPAAQASTDTSLQPAATDATTTPQSTTIVVVPTQVDHPAIHAKAWSAWEAESATVTREDVVAETRYAMQNGLIPRGEIGTVNEDKGSMGPELADQARHERSTQQVYAKVESRYQQMAAAEQERLNQIALAEQQRQQALAAQQAAQQQQALAQPQQPQQPQQ